MTEATLEEAVECMIEGTNATGFCTGSWGKSDTHDYDPDAMYSNMDNIERTCAEGAIIYGAWLRGHDQEAALELVSQLESRYIGEYRDSINGENDRLGHTFDGDVRHNIIGKAKELLWLKHKPHCQRPSTVC